MRNFAYAVEYRDDPESQDWSVLHLLVSAPGKAVREVYDRLGHDPELIDRTRVRRVRSGVELVDLLMDHECNVQEGRDQIGIDLPEA
jgi:hypothetical protein